jgi:hypothetical protein
MTLRCPPGYAIVNGRCVPTEAADEAGGVALGPSQVSSEETSAPPTGGGGSVPPAVLPPQSLSGGYPGGGGDEWARQEAIRRLRQQAGPSSPALPLR